MQIQYTFAGGAAILGRSPYLLLTVPFIGYLRHDVRFLLTLPHDVCKIDVLKHR